MAGEFGERSCFSVPVGGELPSKMPVTPGDGAAWADGHGVPGPAHTRAPSGGSSARRIVLARLLPPSRPGMPMNERTCDACILPLAPSFFPRLLQRSPSSVVSLYRADLPGLCCLLRPPVLQPA